MLFRSTQPFANFFKNRRSHSLIWRFPRRCLAFSSFSPIISLIILLTVCHTILMIYFGKFGSTKNPLTDSFSSWSRTCLLDIVLMLYGEMLYWYVFQIKRNNRRTFNCVKNIILMDDTTICVQFHYFFFHVKFSICLQY